MAMTRAERNAVLEEAAVAAEAEIDPEWPYDDISNQCRKCTSRIRELKEPETSK